MPPSDDKEGVSLREYIDFSIAGLKERIDILLQAQKEAILASLSVADKESAHKTANMTIMVAVIGVLVSIVTIAVIVYLGRR